MGFIEKKVKKQLNKELERVKKYIYINRTTVQSHCVWSDCYLNVNLYFYKVDCEVTIIQRDKPWNCNKPSKGRQKQTGRQKHAHKNKNTDTHA